MEKNKLVQDLDKVNWKSMFIIGQKIGVSNFILQFLSQSLIQHDSGTDILNIFGLNSKILYVYRNEMQSTEQEKIKQITSIHEIDFLNYEQLTPDSLMEIGSNSYYSHLIFDDLKPFYNHKKFNSFVKQSNEEKKQIICGYQSNDKILKRTFLNYMDLIMFINTSISTGSYDIELSSQMDTTLLKRSNYYFIPID